MNTAGVVLRLISLAEFSGALTAGYLGALDWGLALLLDVPTLIVALGALELTDADVTR